jgi:hypothetical protein
MWLLKLLALIFLACVILEPKFRRFVFRLGRKQAPQPGAEEPKPMVTIDPQGSGKGIIVSDERLEQWLAENPDLREANKQICRKP